MTRIAKFIQNEDGAVTVDWVVLTAAIVGLGVAVITTVSNGALDTSSGLGAHLGSRDLGAGGGSTGTGTGSGTGTGTGTSS